MIELDNKASHYFQKGYYMQAAITLNLKLSSTEASQRILNEKIWSQTYLLTFSPSLP